MSEIATTEEMKELALKIKEIEQDYKKAVQETKEAKTYEKELLSKLSHAQHELQAAALGEDYPLFDGKSSDEDEEQELDEAWRKIELKDCDIQNRYRNALFKQEGILTLGGLIDWMQDGARKLTEIAGISKAGAEEISIAIETKVDDFNSQPRG